MRQCQRLTDDTQPILDNNHDNSFVGPQDNVFSASPDGSAGDISPSMYPDDSWKESPWRGSYSIARIINAVWNVSGCIVLDTAQLYLRNKQSSGASAASRFLNGLVGEVLSPDCIHQLGWNVASCGPVSLAGCCGALNRKSPVIFSVSSLRSHPLQTHVNTRASTLSDMCRHAAIFGYVP
jgi:hypothetical protein